MKHFIEFCIAQHDIVCNQKYDKIHPYSFHLRTVDMQNSMFQHLIPASKIHVVTMALYGHDLIEDARVTYNDILENVGMLYSKNDKIEVADIIYACTEEKGKNRRERHNSKYYSELASVEYATYVKLCDIIANVKYSMLTNSSMGYKYKEEYEIMRTHLYDSKYDEMFQYLNNLLNLIK